MYITILRHAGAAGKIGEAAPKVQQGLLPLFKQQQGFLGHAAFASEQGDVVAISIWEDAEAPRNSREKIASWVSANVPELGEVTERFRGEIGTHAILAPQSGGQGLYCMVRNAENLSAPNEHAEAVKNMLAAAQKVPGFRGAYWARSADDQTRGATAMFFDGRESAQAAHEATMAIANKEQPTVKLRVAASGQTAVLAMA
jgi:heme-degrading monooxygenase HmoA